MSDDAVYAWLKSVKNGTTPKLNEDEVMSLVRSGYVFVAANGNMTLRGPGEKAIVDYERRIAAETHSEET